MNNKNQNTFENDASELTASIEYINLTDISDDENEFNVAILTEFCSFDIEELRNMREYSPIPVYVVSSPDISKFKKYLKIKRSTSVSTDFMQIGSSSTKLTADKPEESLLKLSDNFSQKFSLKMVSPTNFSNSFNNKECILIDNNLLVLDTVKVECLSDEECSISSIPSNSSDKLKSVSEFEDNVEKSNDPQEPVHYDSDGTLASTESAVEKPMSLNNETIEAEHDDNSESNKKKKCLFPVRRTRAKPSPIVEDSPMPKLGKRRAEFPLVTRSKAMQSYQNFVEQPLIFPKTPTSYPFSDSESSRSSKMSPTDVLLRTVVKSLERNISRQSTENCILPGNDMVNSASFENAVAEEQGVTSMLHTNLIESRIRNEQSGINQRSLTGPHHNKRVDEKRSSAKYPIAVHEPEMNNCKTIVATAVQNQEVRTLKRKYSTESTNEEKHYCSASLVVQPITKTVKNRNCKPTTAQQRVNLQQENSLDETVSHQSANSLHIQGSAKSIFPNHRVNILHNLNSAESTVAQNRINTVNSRSSIEPTISQHKASILQTQCSAEHRVLQQNPNNCSSVESTVVQEQEIICLRSNSVESLVPEIGTKQSTSLLCPAAENRSLPFSEIDKLPLKSIFQDTVVETMSLLQYLEYINVSSNYFGCFENAFKEIVAEAKSRSSNIDCFLNFLTERDNTLMLQSCLQLLNLVSCQFLTIDKISQINLASSSLEKLLLILKKKSSKEQFIDLKLFAIATSQKTYSEILSLLQMFIKYKNCEIPHKTELANICKKIIAYQDETNVTIDAKSCSEVLSGRLAKTPTSNTENKNQNQESLQTSLHENASLLPQATCDPLRRSYPVPTTISHDVAITNSHVDTTNNFCLLATNKSQVVTTDAHVVTTRSHMKPNALFTSSSPMKTSITVNAPYSRASNPVNFIESSPVKTHGACNKSTNKTNLSSLLRLKKEDIEKLVDNFSSLPKECQEEVDKYLTCLEVTEPQYVSTLRKHLPKY